MHYYTAISYYYWLANICVVKVSSNLSTFDLVYPNIFSEAVGESVSGSGDEGDSDSKRRSLARRRSSVKDKIAALDRNSNETPAEKLGIVRNNSNPGSRISGIVKII